MLTLFKVMLFSVSANKKWQPLADICHQHWTILREAVSSCLGDLGVERGEKESIGASPVQIFKHRHLTVLWNSVVLKIFYSICLFCVVIMNKKVFCQPPACFFNHWVYLAKFFDALKKFSEAPKELYYDNNI